MVDRSGPGTSSVHQLTDSCTLLRSNNTISYLHTPGPYQHHSSTLWSRSAGLMKSCLLILFSNFYKDFLINPRYPTFSSSIISSSQASQLPNTLQLQQTTLFHLLPHKQPNTNHQNEVHHLSLRSRCRHWRCRRSFYSPRGCLHDGRHSHVDHRVYAANMR